MSRRALHFVSDWAFGYTMTTQSGITLRNLVFLFHKTNTKKICEGAVVASQCNCNHRDEDHGAALSVTAGHNLMTDENQNAKIHADIM